MLDMRIISGSANEPLAEKIAENLGVKLTQREIGTFADGEIRTRILESVRGTDVFLIQPTSAPTSAHIMELLILLDALKRASARRVTAVVPYYAYARQEKKVQPREPITARLMADLIVAAGAHRVLLVDVHVATIQGFFNIPCDHLPAGPLLADYFDSAGFSGGDTVVVSPDAGGVPRAKILADRLNVPLTVIAKRRLGPNQCMVVEILGEVEGKRVLLVDDLVDTAGSIVEGARALQARGAKEIYACATHGVLSPPAIERLSGGPINKLVITDTIPLPAEKNIPEIEVISISRVLADAIRRLHDDTSLSTIYDRFWR